MKHYSCIICNKNCDHIVKSGNFLYNISNTKIVEQTVFICETCFNFIIKYICFKKEYHTYTLSKKQILSICSHKPGQANHTTQAKQKCFECILSNHSKINKLIQFNNLT